MPWGSASRREHSRERAAGELRHVAATGGRHPEGIECAVHCGKTHAQFTSDVWS